ncbi:hypothetical protein F5B22DRAFT_458317 [Xylaria bambusicola]|uniref:uncharacterized protein n=1 Tax=Xylaria bambusicola TaxID=326684 RepID=UPI0020077611|nr:uncharacterized protein F5B22DRAFT_458317 [Xylaria bambusicola]KAI0522091.1 hypothetical protein F5B22DRAFT_458317 [Xylaria bambusicola]
MLSTNRSSAGSMSSLDTEGRFQFITVHAPSGPRSPATRRLARSHAVKRALEKKRKIERESKKNFRIITIRDEIERTHEDVVAMSPFSLSAGTLDPFRTLAVDSSRLQALLSDYKARQSLEPVFNIVTLESFRSIFRTGLVDPALLTAVMHTLAFAEAGDGTDREWRWYQGQAFSYVRERIGTPDTATSEPTIGAILLLAGVEARLGMTSQVQLHMDAVRRLLSICKARGITLTDGIKRAIFWQDLNASILAGSRRIVDHATFSELRWTRNSCPPSFFRLPPGFQMHPDLFTKDFIEVLEDLHALQCLRNTISPLKSQVSKMEYINNHTAYIQSRIMNLPKPHPAVFCCYLAACLCSVMMCCRVWCAPVIPSHFSTQLLRELQQANDDPLWDSRPDLLLWLLYSGGAFAPTATTRSDYIALLRSNNGSRFKDLYKSWSELHVVMKQFIWSDRAFKSPVKKLWEETLAQTSSMRHINDRSTT